MKGAINKMNSILHQQVVSGRLLCCKVMLLVFFLGGIGGGDALAQYTEYEQKAALILALSKRVTWPNKAFDHSNKLVLGILGDDPFGAIIDSVLLNRSANGRFWRIKRGHSIKDLKGSHIIFIGNSYSQDEIKSILESIYSKNNPTVLTIGDNIDNFCKMGGVINLTISANPNTLYSLNVVAANRAQLTMDVKLLNLASDIVPYEDN